MRIIDYIKDITRSILRRTLDDIQRDIKYKIYSIADGAYRRVMRRFTSTLLILLSAAFFSIAAVFFFIEYMQLSRTISFLIIGIIILLIGLIMKIV